jgi:hypothetical protein
MLACDFLSVETVGLTRLYAFFVIELEHRRVHLVGITALRVPNIPSIGGDLPVLGYD